MAKYVPITIFLIAVALGGTTAVDTLGSQVFASGIDPFGLGVILQRAYMILTLFYIPVAALWWFSQPVFVALGQEDFISEWSCKFLRTLIPGGLGYILFETTKKYLQAQGTFSLCPIDVRHHACIKLRPSHHLPLQRRPQLSFRLHLQFRSPRRTRRNRNNLLALLPPSPLLRQIRPRRSTLGRLVQTRLPRLVALHSTRAHGRPSSRDRMARLRDYHNHGRAIGDYSSCSAECHCHDGSIVEYDSVWIGGCRE